MLEKERSPQGLGVSIFDRQLKKALLEKELLLPCQKLTEVDDNAHRNQTFYEAYVAAEGPRSGCCCSG